PFSLMRTILVTAMTGAFIVAAINFKGLFSLVALTPLMLLILMPLMLFTIFTMMTLTHLIDHVLPLREDMFQRKKKQPKER
ncbi:MAG: hypothetical protein RSC76_07615, partial [Oscillospiraceae bacterium]